MNGFRTNCGLLLLAAMVFWVANLQAAEKAGLLVEISKKTVGRQDKVTVNGVGNMTVDRDLAFKVDVKNVSNKESAAATVDTVVLIQRWESETGSIEKSDGHAALEALHPAQTTSVNVGQFHIGGHMHGSSTMHVDQVVAWKVVITRDGQKIDFTSGTNFETLEKKAKTGIAPK